MGVLTDEEATRLTGAPLVSGDGEELGSVETVLTHAADNRAAWAAAATEDGVVLVPLDGAQVEGERLLVRYDAEQIRSAPAHDGGEQLDAGAAERYYAHYGIDDSSLRDDSGFATEQGVRQRGAGDPRAGGGADDAAQGHP